MDSRKSHNTADSVNGVEARIGQQSAMPGLAKRVAIKRTLAARYKITIRVRCKIWVFPTSERREFPEAVKAGNAGPPLQPIPGVRPMTSVGCSGRWAPHQQTDGNVPSLS